LGWFRSIIQIYKGDTRFSMHESKVVMCEDRDYEDYLQKNILVFVGKEKYPQIEEFISPTKGTLSDDTPADFVVAKNDSQTGKIIQFTQQRKYSKVDVVSLFHQLYWLERILQVINKYSLPKSKEGNHPTKFVLVKTHKLEDLKELIENKKGLNLFCEKIEIEHFIV